VNLRNVQYKRQQWAGRVAHYQREKQLITQSYKNDEKGQQQAVDLLQQRLFNENEIKRVNALERIEASRRIPK
jgi:lipase chaperone LimK